jgi:hypothetical protein
MNLLRTLRESAEPIQGLCQLQNSGELVSYDKSALRLWSTHKQLRAVHWISGSPEAAQSLKLVDMFPFDQVSGVLLVFIRHQEGKESATILRIVSDQLKTLQEVKYCLTYCNTDNTYYVQLELSVPLTKKVLLSEDRQTLLLLGILYRIIARIYSVLDL